MANNWKWHWRCDSNLKISVRPDKSSIITKKINDKGKIKEISLVGSNRMDYQKSNGTIKLLEDLIIGQK